MKTPLRFHTLDVFTNTKFNGKALAVVESCDNLSDFEMSSLAREFNLPATAFLCAPRDPVNSVSLRTFVTNGAELAFSAHSLIGAAALIAQTRALEILSRREVVVAIETGNSVFSSEVIRSKAGVAYAQFALEPGAAGIPPTPPDINSLARALSLEPRDIGFGRHAPRIYGAHRLFTLAPVISRTAIDEASPSGELLGEVLGETVGLLLYTSDTIEPDSAVHARLFAHTGAEDPANGEAAAAFAWAACEFERPDDGEHQIFMEQGHSMGRPSRLTLGMNIQGGRLQDIRLGGQAVQICKGELEL